MKFVLFCVMIIFIGGALLLWLVGSRGFSAREKPHALEELLARNLRQLAIPAGARAAVNPVPASPAVIIDAMAHFADHCASCHANDGSGNAEIGQSLYPPAPDMRKEATQSLTDGELFYVIHNGIRFTGMPAWGPDDPARDRSSWELVHFIRHLPDLADHELAEMKTLNPRSRHEIEEEEATRRFLEGGEGPGSHQDGSPHRH